MHDFWRREIRKLYSPPNTPELNATPERISRTMTDA